MLWRRAGNGGRHIAPQRPLGVASLTKVKTETARWNGNGEICSSNGKAPITMALVIGAFSSKAQISPFSALHPVVSVQDLVSGAIPSVSSALDLPDHSARIPRREHSRRHVTRDD